MLLSYRVKRSTEDGIHELGNDDMQNDNEDVRSYLISTLCKYQNDLATTGLRNGSFLANKPI